jgi:hypothetical protein
MNTNTLSQVTKWLRWIRDLERVSSLEMCHGVNALALVLNVISEKLGFQRMWWLGGIYSPQPLCSCWTRLLAMGAPDSPVRHRTGTVHCPVHATSAQMLGFWAVDVGVVCRLTAPDSLVPHWTFRCPLTLLLWLCYALFAFTVHSAVDRCTHRAVALLAHWTIRWHTGQSGEL